MRMWNRMWRTRGHGHGEWPSRMLANPADVHQRLCSQRTAFSHASPPCSRYGQSARPLAECLLRITEHAASQQLRASPTLDAWESFRPQTHPAHAPDAVRNGLHGLPTSGSGHKRAKKGTCDPALLARLEILGITCFWVVDPL